MTHPHTDHPPGVHLLIDCWGAEHLTDAAYVEQALIDAAEAVGATLLHVFTRSFGEGEGVTSIAVLAESHISLHSWPEIEYAAFDVFVCGSADAHKAVAIIEDRFKPRKITTDTVHRGEKV